MIGDADPLIDLGPGSCPERAHGFDLFEGGGWEESARELIDFLDTELG